MMPLTMTPVGATGDSDPAVAPCPTMIAIRKAGMCARAAAAIAMGATSAVVAMCPGPSDARTQARAKNIIGISPALPRQRRSACRATLSSVPFSCACVKSIVTPASVTKSDTGKPAMTSFRLIPAYRPMSHAKAIASTPTFSGEKQLTRMATSNAPSEIHARLIGACPAATAGGRRGGPRRRR